MWIIWKSTIPKDSRFRMWYGDGPFEVGGLYGVLSISFLQMVVEKGRAKFVIRTAEVHSSYFEEYKFTPLL